MRIATGVELPMNSTDTPSIAKMPPPTIPPKAMAINSVSPSGGLAFCAVVLIIYLGLRWGAQSTLAGWGVSLNLFFLYRLRLYGSLMGTKINRVSAKTQMCDPSAQLMNKRRYFYLIHATTILLRLNSVELVFSVLAG